MSKGDYERDLRHRAKLQAKRERLAGLRELYRTYEQTGQAPMRGSYMWDLRARIHSVEAQLRVMAESDIEEKVA